MELTREEAIVLTDWNYQYYCKHAKEFKKENPGQYVVIKNQSVFGFYGSFAEAYKAITAVAMLGTFIIQDCDQKPIVVM